MERNNSGDEQASESSEDQPNALLSQAGISSIAGLSARLPLSSRLELLERLAAASSMQYSPELLAMLQREQVERSIQLSNSILQSLRAREYPIWTAAPLPPSLAAMPIPFANNAPPQILSLLPEFAHHLQQRPMQHPTPVYAHRYADMSLQSALIPQQAADRLAHDVGLPPSESLLQLQQRWQEQRRNLLHNRLERPRQCEPSVEKVAMASAPDSKVAAASAAISTRTSHSARRERTSRKTNRLNKSSSPSSSASKKLKADPDDPVASIVSASATGDNNQSAVYLRCIKRRRYRTETFPNKLLRMIETAKKDGQQHLISFTEDGTAVRTPFPAELTEVVFPQFFRHKNFASFQRQLSMYGFLRIVEGDNKGSYAHPLFLEGRPELVQQIKRISEFELVDDQSANHQD